MDSTTTGGTSWGDWLQNLGSQYASYRLASQNQSALQQQQMYQAQQAQNLNLPYFGGTAAAASTRTMEYVLIGVAALAAVYFLAKA